MKLTQTIRGEFLNKILASAKARNYADEAEAVWSKIIVTQMPAAVAEIYQGANTKWVNTDEIARIRRDMKEKRSRNSSMPAGVVAHFKALDDIEDAREKHSKALDNIREAITTASMSVTTVTGLAKLFPQYKHFLPKDGLRPSKEAAQHAVAQLQFGLSSMKADGATPAIKVAKKRVRTKASR